MNSIAEINTTLPTFKGSQLSQALADADAFLANLGVEGATMSAELLLEYVMGLERGQIFIKPNLTMPETEAERYSELLKLRAEGQPVAYLTGTKGFWDFELKVTPDTLIPRPETELLVESALEFQKGRNKLLNILDLGTGSGAIIIALLREFPNAKGTAVDISAKTLEVARQNAADLEVADRLGLVQSDWFENLLPEEGDYDLIVSNPPYIKSKDMLTLQKEVRLFEPPKALHGGADGLEQYRVIIEKAHLYLKPQGWLGFETGEHQHKDISVMLKATGQYHNIKSIKDYAGHERILWAQKK